MVDLAHEAIRKGRDRLCYRAGGNERSGLEATKADLKGCIRRRFQGCCGWGVFSIHLSVACE